MGELINGRELADKMQAQIKEEVQDLEKKAFILG